MKIKGFLQDVGGAGRVTKKREELFSQADKTDKANDPISAVAKELHPDPMMLTITEITVVSPTAKKYRLIAKDGVLPPFQAGQYVSLEMKIGDTLTTRPYSICSAPFEARNGKDSFIEITVRKGRECNFVANYFYNEAKVGSEFRASLPFGHFYYEELRDAKNIVALAGGSGITPFYSMAKEIEHGTLDVNLTILYGSVSTKDIILNKELSAIKSEKVRFINVISGEDDYQGEKGFITADLIKKYSQGDTSYFVCGPLAMYNFVASELKKLKIPQRRIRMEIFGAPSDISKAKGYPQGLEDKVFSLTVIRGIHQDVIPALAKENLADAIERAGIKIPTNCRSGACGFCRCKLEKGEVFVPQVGNGRRKADEEANYIHACSTYPLSDCTVKIPIL
ncbi:MAG: flavin reductase family protein [Bacilli bacterium]